MIWNRKIRIFAVLTVMTFINVVMIGCGSVQNEDRASVEDTAKTEETDAAADITQDAETSAAVRETAG
ncbi:MAG: hypothetical protein K2J04_11070, partial [Lachnospiraceae bacterium]|nr:hypothetical protein [Lachnospiraceae bacterium]